jgi:hypothetical protein
MRVARFWLLFFPLLFSCSVGAQQPTASQPIQKDAAALAILDQMVKATGWNPTSLPLDLVATGTMTIYIGTDSNSYPVTYKLKGGSQISTELAEDAGTSRTVSNGKIAGAILPDGTVVPLPSYLAHSMRQMVFPFMTQITNSAAPDISVGLAGTLQINGTLCNGVALAHHLARTDPLAFVEDLASPMTIWISSTTGLPVQIDYALTGINNFKAVLHLSKTFSDYRIVNGVAVPFHQEEILQGQKNIVLDLIGVQFNTALTDADFYVPVTRGGR